MESCCALKAIWVLWRPTDVGFCSHFSIKRPSWFFPSRSKSGVLYLGNNVVFLKTIVLLLAAESWRARNCHFFPKTFHFFHLLSFNSEGTLFSKTVDFLAWSTVLRVWTLQNRATTSGNRTNILIENYLPGFFSITCQSNNFFRKELCNKILSISSPVLEFWR